MSKTRAVWLFIGGLTLIRLSMLGSTDLEFDEAHYWMWSERLAPGYFSKGPGIAFNVTPIFNVGAFVMTTDALSIFFWMAATFTFWLAVGKSPQFSFYWPLTGLLIGLGFLSRWINAFEIVCVLLVLAFAPRLRQEFKRPGLYLLLGVFAVCTIPPIVWNAQHAWVTFSHLKTRGG